MLWPEVSQICTEWMEWMSHRERKLSSSRQPGTAGPGNILGCCLVSLCLLCDIHSIHSSCTGKKVITSFKYVNL